MEASIVFIYDRFTTLLKIGMDLRDGTFLGLNIGLPGRNMYATNPVTADPESLCIIAIMVVDEDADFLFFLCRHTVRACCYFLAATSLPEGPDWT